jgi:hypothetical protein
MSCQQARRALHTGDLLKLLVKLLYARVMCAALAWATVDHPIWAGQQALQAFGLEAESKPE